MARYSLSRESDGAGDCGMMSTIFWQEGEGRNIELKWKDNSKPKVGTFIQVGSQHARSYQAQDYWQTSYITEILEETENRVRFKTQNSIYIWEKF